MSDPSVSGDRAREDEPAEAGPAAPNVAPPNVAQMDVAQMDVAPLDLVPTDAAPGRDGVASKAEADGDIGPAGTGPSTGAGAARVPGSRRRILTPEERSRRRRRTLIEWVVVFAIALGVSGTLRAWVFESFTIPTASMEPTLQIGDHIVVDKRAYDFHGMHRGDIVVFVSPPTFTGEPPGTDLVKRVIGLPGETVSLAAGKVLIDGKAISEPYLPAGTITQDGPGGTAWGLSRPYTVPPDHYFVMGDNRADSEDSRWFGPIAGHLIVGKVDLLIWRKGSLAFHLFS